MLFRSNRGARSLRLNSMLHRRSPRDHRFQSLRTFSNIRLPSLRPLSQLLLQQYLKHLLPSSFEQTPRKSHPMDLYPRLPRPVELVKRSLLFPPPPYKVVQDPLGLLAKLNRSNPSYISRKPRLQYIQLLKALLACHQILLACRTWASNPVCQ